MTVDTEFQPTSPSMPYTGAGHGPGHGPGRGTSHGTGDPQIVAQLAARREAPVAKKTRRERRDDARAAARRRAARAAMSSRGTFGPDVVGPTYGPTAETFVGAGPRALADVQPVPGKRAGLRYGAILVVLALALMATIATGLPVLGHPTDPSKLAGGLAVSSLVAAAAWWASAWLRARNAVLGALGVVLVVTVFFLGAQDTLVIDGKPLLATSPTAGAYTMRQDMQADLNRMRNADQFLALDQVDARAAFDLLSPAKSELEVIVQRWAAPHDWPSPEFKAAGADLKTAAHFAALSMQDKIDWVTTGDVALAEDGAQQRSSFTSSYLSGAQLLQDGAAKFKLPGSEFGPNGPSE